MPVQERGEWSKVRGVAGGEVSQDWLSAALLGGQVHSGLWGAMPGEFSGSQPWLPIRIAWGDV